MPKDEGGGLFSKVVKLVRSTTGNWSEAEQEAAESQYSKQMLKEMIERKRRNDFVRKREFDMLRKMRRSEVMAGQDPAARPSFFQSSLPSKPDDRASTLKKIDEIEAQMSMQWWKHKHGDASRGSSTNFPLSAQMPDLPSRPSVPPAPAPAAAPAGGAAGPGPLRSTSYVRTAPQQLPSAPAPVTTTTVPEPLLDFTIAAPLPSTAPVPPPEPPPTTAPVPPPLARRSPLNAPVNRGPLGMFAGTSDSGTPSGFSASKVFAIDVDEFAHDPELEEAAIRFANGDDAGAEAGLQEVLAPGGSRVEHDETWLTLFDLYRATGQQGRFEAAAIEFAGRFGRSAPQWLSLPGQLGLPAAGAAAPAAAATADWSSPASLGTQAVATLSAALARAQPPWHLSWLKLATIEAAAVEPLARLVAQWSRQPVQLRFIGSDNLERVLKDATPSGDKGVSPAWWKLRMELLRVMHRPDEFELVALDYCVTYEVSPPSWESARCDFKPVQADGSSVGGHTLIGEAVREAFNSNIAYGDTQVAGQSQQTSHVVSVELAGHVLGDAHEAIEMLDGRLAGADVMVISCARLIRIDFTAAGSLLNWVSARHTEGRQVQFVDVHRLVAAFFNVVGIGEHARVMARRD
jgi:hypothetical protein